MMRRSLTILALLCVCTGVSAKGGGGGGGHASSGHSSSHASSSHATSAHSESHGVAHTESHPVFIAPQGHAASASSTSSTNPQVAAGTTGQTSDPDAPSYKLWILGGVIFGLLIAFIVTMFEYYSIIDKHYGRKP